MKTLAEMKIGSKTVQIVRTNKDKLFYDDYIWVRVKEDGGKWEAVTKKEFYRDEYDLLHAQITFEKYAKQYTREYLASYGEVMNKEVKEYAASKKAKEDEWEKAMGIE